ncbi:carbonic anhydrase [Planctomicrobium sp. SH664]|uniref:carbonic anhydrase n=1 Tax=Planctomicrobium sp. SH664 TaxID=3448125 RepID=UPI003F5AFC37
MKKLVTGIHRFTNNVFTEERELFSELSNGQKPMALFITCADSRICPNLLTQTKPGDLFTLRVAGNIVPPYGSGAGGEAATIEYAVSVLRVSDVIVCGHSLCGAVSALVDDQNLERYPALNSYLKHAEATRRIMAENYSKTFDEDERLNLAIQENVLVQLENLRTHPSVLSALSRKQLNLHGWVYKMETGQVFGYNSEQEQFVPVQEGDRPMSLQRPIPQLSAI